MAKKTQYVNIDDVIEKATKKAIREYDKEKVEEQRKQVFQNTRLLLQHYNDFKDHIQNSIDDINKIDINKIDITNIDKEELYIMSIKKSKTKTLIMLAHIDAALEALKNKQKKLGCSFKYDALVMYYIDGYSMEEIQEYFKCGKNTPGRWLNQMVNELSVLLFGVDGLKMDMVK